MERVDIRTVVDEDCAYRILEVARNQTLKPLLTCGVPELQPIRSIVMYEILREEVYPYGGVGFLCITIVDESLND